MSIYLASFTTLLYLCAAACQGLRLAGSLQAQRNIAIGLGLSAVAFHTLLLYFWIDTAAGQNLSIFNLFSLVTWLIALLVGLAALTRPIENLGVFIFPLAAISILLIIFFPTQDIINTRQNYGQLVHILLSTLTLSVLCVAALQAILLRIQDRQLHHKHLKGVVRVLPPLEIMESLLFQIIGLGFILLTLVLITSLLFFQNPFSVHHLQKTLMSMASWTIFAALLIGRTFFGWRGPIATQWILGGVSLLILLYFGSKFLYAWLFVS